MLPLNIILDTNILSKDKNLAGKYILLIKKLSQLKLINLHLPWIVCKEFTSQRISEMSDNISNALRSIRSITQINFTDSEQSVLNNSSSILESKIDIISQIVEKNWNNFIAESKAEIHDIEGLHGKSVMNSYFKGTKPFKRIKNKDDIPDAFVFESVSSIVNSNNNAVFICGDKFLRTSANEIKNIEVFESFDAFFKSKVYKPVESEYYKKEHYATELIELIKRLDILEEIISDGVINLLLSKIYSDVESNKIPSDNNEGTFVNLEEIYSSVIDKDNIVFINDIFYLKVIVKGSARIEYFLYKWDEHQIENRKNAEIIDNDWNDHYYEVGESYDFKVSFDCSISKDKINLIEELYSKGDSGFLEIDESSVSFDELTIT